MTRWKPEYFLDLLKGELNNGATILCQKDLQGLVLAHAAISPLSRIYKTPETVPTARFSGVHDRMVGAEPHRRLSYTVPPKGFTRMHFLWGIPLRAGGTCDRCCLREGSQLALPLCAPHSGRHIPRVCWLSLSGGASAAIRSIRAQGSPHKTAPDLTRAFSACDCNPSGG